MVIVKRGDGATSVYAVCSECRETGDKHAREIVTFNTFENAVLVMKYMRGDRLTQRDIEHAKDIISKVL